jgi:sugar phosphate isomerase/epimerase
VTPRFGISTHLFHGERLSRGHLEQVAAHGFRLVEVFATRTHFDYHDARHISETAEWLHALGLSAWSLHAPICASFVHGVWGRAYSNAMGDDARRREAVEETSRSIKAARDLGCSVVVLHTGTPRGQPIELGDNDPRALSRSLEPIAEACRLSGIRLALEVIPNDLATPRALIDWLEGDLELFDTGVCLDVGHAHLMGGTVEAAEALSGHMLTTHLHDNTGRSDDHLLPFDGTVDWPATLMALSKVGYSGPLVFELPDHGNAGHVLERLVGVTRRIQAILEDLAAPLEFGP